MAAGVIGDQERLINEQGQLVEHLVALHITTAADELRGVKVEAADKHR